MVKNNNKKPMYVLLTITTIVLMFAALHVGIIMENGPAQTLFTALALVPEHIAAGPFNVFPIQWDTLFLFAAVDALLVVYLIAKQESVRQDAVNIEHGSADWMSEKEKVAYHKNFMEPFKKTKYTHDNNILMSQTIGLSMQDFKTRRNLNQIVIGGSGTGKSRFVVKPNILQAHSSYVVTDPSGELLESTGAAMEKLGYKVKVFNLIDMANSYHYNPFHYIRRDIKTGAIDDNGVVDLVKVLVANTEEKGKTGGDGFWTKAEIMLLQALCFFLVHFCEEDDQNFSNVMDLIRKAEISEDDPDLPSILDCIYEEIKAEWKEINPEVEHIATMQYDAFKVAAGKTLKSIIISVNARLVSFNLPDVQYLTGTDNLELEKIGDEKTILYCVIPSSKETFNFLCSLMYSQLFETLYYHAENECKGKRLALPVRFLIDEFANIGVIPNYEKILATCRKYRISVVTILQNLAQLKALYKDSNETIIGNCDSMVFLGSPETATLKYISERLGDTTIRTRSNSNSVGRGGSISNSYSMQKRPLMTPDEVGRIDNNYCIVFVRGERPVLDKKYNYENHPRYKMTGDHNKNNMYVFDINKMNTPVKNKKPKPNSSTEVKTINPAMEIKQAEPEVQGVPLPVGMKLKGYVVVTEKGKETFLPVDAASIADEYLANIEQEESVYETFNPKGFAKVEEFSPKFEFEFPGVNMFHEIEEELTSVDELEEGDDYTAVELVSTISEENYEKPGSEIPYKTKLEFDGEDLAEQEVSEDEEEFFKEVSELQSFDQEIFSPSDFEDEFGDGTFINL